MLYKLFKSCLNKTDPELAHKLAIKFIKNPLLSGCISSKIPYENLNQNLFNLNFASPIGLAAGFDKNAEIYNYVEKFGFSFSEVGTVTPEPQFGNSKPRVFRLVHDRAIINRLGFPNDGMEIIKKRMEKNIPNGICGINVGPNKKNATLPDDYLLCFDEFFEIASYITFNISSPNTPDLRLQHEENKIIKLIEVIQKKRVEKNSLVPILFKISPDLEEVEIKSLCEIFLEKDIDGLILTNTTVKNKENLISHFKFEEGGLSGSPLNSISNEIIKKFYKYTGGRIPIIGVGGVNNGKTAFEKIKSGASLLQLYTSIVYEGPFVANNINKELSCLLKENGYKSISDAIGVYCK